MDKLLEQFCEIATLKSVSKAAKKLSLTQPTLTQNIKRLEKELGVCLLNRTQTGVYPTEYGELVLEHGYIIKRVFDSLSNRISLLKQKNANILRIGTGHAWWIPFTKNVVTSYREKTPSANICIEFGNHLRLLDQLLSCDIDLFIGHEVKGVAQKDSLLFIPLFTCKDAIFVRENHPLLLHKCSMKDLMQYPTLSITPDEKRYVKLIEDFQEKGIEINNWGLNEKIIFSTNSLMAGIDILKETNAVMPYPEDMKDYFEKHNLHSLNMIEQYNQGIVGIYTHKELANKTHIEFVVDLIKKHANDYTQSKT